MITCVIIYLIKIKARITGFFLLLAISFDLFIFLKLAQHFKIY